MKFCRWLPVALMLVLLVLVACNGGETTSDANITYEYADADSGSAGGEAAQIEGPSPAEVPVASTLVMEGKLKAVHPELKLAFPGEIKGRLATLYVRAGQMVQAGDLIATLDDSELQKAVAEAQVVLDRAREDREKEAVKRETAYRKALAEAEKKYQDAIKEAEKALANAKSAQIRAWAKPPDAIQPSEAKLEQARETEKAAALDYQHALDAPWEPQSTRDTAYRNWQQSISARQAAEKELDKAHVEVQLYNMDLAEKKRAVADAQAKLEGLKQDEVERNTDYTQLDRAIVDAEKKLRQAQQNLERSRLYAPAEGLVLAVNAAEGGIVGPETTIVTLLNVKEFYFVTKNMSERHFAQLHDGQQATITLRAYEDQVLTGHVETVLLAEKGGEQGNSPFVAYIRLDPTDLYLLPGMSGKVEIINEKE